MIKKVQDNKELADQILEKHKIYPLDMQHHYDDEKSPMMKDTHLKGKGPKEQQYQHRKLYFDNYNALYKAVGVCKTCFLVYSLLSDYFDELIKATTTFKKNDYYLE
mmetsp:Transcript_24161/g.23748  ORF Transcript_24161/g.23748 Transcript_24161/m.23748 type:complete len:106 (+) Transcript_24161:189-506(+)